MLKNLTFGRDILCKRLGSLKKYILVTMEEPYKLISDMAKPVSIIYNYEMTEENLEKLARERRDGEYIVGFGGGTACDTAKYLSSKWNLPLIIAPSVVSVDAWLCKSIAVRHNYKVRYIGDVTANEFIVDYAIMQKSPEILNKAGVSDVLSITTALGDWRISRDVFGDRYDVSYYDTSYNIAKELLLKEREIAMHSEEGLKSIVRGQLMEVLLCEDWGNSRPEEGGEHFLAYCLEELTHKHYIHGLLIALNILVVLKLQRDRAVFDYREIARFFKNIGLDISFQKQNITREEYREALMRTGEYVKRENLYNGIFSLNNIFDEKGEYSLDEIVEWASSL
jgi:glycerol-1-phosphate dehydrogenase [NAD(P)+]